MTLLIATGCWSLALGAISGWPLAILSQAGPRRPGWRFLREPKRLMQLHLDWIMMGSVLIAVGVAVPGLPAWVTALILVGAVVNPLLFLPLAVHGSHLRNRRTYRAAAAASFTALSGGLIAAAVVATA